MVVLGIKTLYQIMRILKIAGLSVLYGLLGFSREYFFESINIKLFYLWRDEYDVIMEETLAFLNDYSYWTLYWLKWLLTGLYTGLYLIAALVVVRMFFPAHYKKYVIISYLIVIALAIITFGSGYLIKNVDSNYAVTRQLMEWLQSPIMLLVLIPGFLLLKNKKEGV